MNFVEVHLNDYAAATFHLSPLEDGIYWRLLRCYYRDEQLLPVEIADVARMVGARTADEIRAVEVVLKEFFSPESDGWRQSRCDEEIERVAEKREKAREAAAASWEKRRGNADAKRSHSDRNASHSPTTHSPIGIKKRFDAFYAAYPKKKSKAQAETAFQKLSPDDELLTVILDAIEAQTKERALMKSAGEFVPEWKHPATWLNARAWEDDVDLSPRTGGSNAAHQREDSQSRGKRLRAEAERNLDAAEGVARLGSDAGNVR